MFRLGPVWVAVAFSAVLVSLPARAAEWDEAPPNEEPLAAEPLRGNGDVSVDLEGATPGLSPEFFRATLSPYGDWYVSARYGSVWRPRIAAGWRPYFYGSWLWTDEGWYWDSGEPFAWAVYHYGRWVFDPAWGWVWVPGYQWAPAWVAWRFGVDVVGWAPLGPGVSVFVTTYPFYDDWWCFVPTVRFVGVPIQTVAYPRREIPRWFHATKPAPPRTTAAPPRAGSVAPAWGGPSRAFIEERTGRPIAVERRAPTARPWPTEPERARDRAPAMPRAAERGPSSTWAPPGREESHRAPPAGRPEVRPAPRREEGQRPVSPGRPEIRPEPRREESAPPARAPASRGGGRDRARGHDR